MESAHNTNSKVKQAGPPRFHYVSCLQKLIYSSFAGSLSSLPPLAKPVRGKNEKGKEKGNPSSLEPRQSRQPASPLTNHPSISFWKFRTNSLRSQVHSSHAVQQSPPLAHAQFQWSTPCVHFIVRLTVALENGSWRYKSTGGSTRPTLAQRILTMGLARPVR